MSKRQTAESQCRDCHEPILWARNSATGRSLPLDLTPARDGKFILDDLSMMCTELDLPMIERAIERRRSLYSNHLIGCVVRNQRNGAQL